MPQDHELHKYHSSEKLKSIGQDLYKQKKYNEALEVFSAATAAADGPDLTLFDHLAATNERLENYQAALKDGRHMLQLDKTAVIGYLRTARVLQKLQQPDLALKIYERGLRHVPSSHADFEVLRYKHKKLLRDLVPPKSIDPFAILPIEIIDMIMRYLGFNQVCQCLRVSKGWQTLLTSWPSFWINLDFSKAKKTVRATTIYNYLAYARCKVSHFILKKVDLQGATLLKYLVRKCSNLESLEIQTGGWLAHLHSALQDHSRHLKRIYLSSSVIVEGKTVLRIMNACQSLSTAEFGDVRKMKHLCGEGAPFWADVNLSNLREFTMGYERSSPPTSHVTLDMLCPPATHLQSLKLKSNPLQLGSIDNINDSRHLHRAVDSVDFRCIAKRYPHLERLNIDCISHRMNTLMLPKGLRVIELRETRDTFFLGSDDITEQYPPLPHLSEVILRQTGVSEIGVSEFGQILDAQNHSDGGSDQSFLDRLDIRLCATWFEDIINLLHHPRLQHLTYLGLPELQTHTSDWSMDDLAKLVAGNFERLETLDLSGNRGLTGIGIKAFVQSCPLLKTLLVGGCDKIGSDAIEWLRARGVLVRHRNI